jgi:PAS domain S-box-containing protein
MISQQQILDASILIVDDQEANVLLLEQMLQESGYDCITTTMDPHLVSELHRKNHYDLILLDLQMPGMDGFQVMEELKKIDTSGYVPILVITAQPDHKLRALAAGAKDFVAKPFDLIEVQTRIHNMLEVRLLYKQLDAYNKALEQTVFERTAELRASEMRYRRLTELSSDWYWEQNETGQFTRIFGPVFEMLGIRFDETLGITKDDQGASWNEEEREILMSHLLSRSPFLDMVYCRTNAEGVMQYLMVSGEPMFDTSGSFYGYRGTGKDVTETVNPLPD